MAEKFFAIRNKKTKEWFTTNYVDYDFETSKELYPRYLYSKKEAEKEVELYADMFQFEIVPITLTWVEHE